MAHALDPVCSVALFFFPPSSYDLISKCWQEPNGEDSDESARLQFQELEVRITVRGGERQRRIENTLKAGRAMMDTIVANWIFVPPKSYIARIVGMRWDFRKHPINCPS